MTERKIIIFDVDGVLTPFDRHIISLVRPETTDQEIENLCNWDTFLLLNEEQKTEISKIMKDLSFWESLEPNPLSQKIVNLCRKNDEEVIFCTSPWEECVGWDQTRRDWLKKHFGAKGRSDVVSTDRKDLVFGNIFIDDKPENVVSWKKRWHNNHSCFGLLYETLSNKCCKIYPRIRPISNSNKWEIIRNE